jgi:hypothetical protein
MNYIDHIVKYTVKELREIDKNGEAFRKYPQNQKLSLFDNKIITELVSSQNIIEISNIGNVRINGQIIAPFEKEKGYYYVHLFNKVEYKVYRLVAETWVYFPFENTNGFHVHHIINDGTKNTAENLIWVEANVHLHEIH